MPHVSVLRTGTLVDSTQRRFVRRNYVALLLDGGFYSAGMAFVAADTVLPTVLQALGASTWLIALGPTLGMYGFFVMPFFTAHLVDRLARFLPYVAWLSVPQRLPPLIAGLALLFFWETHPRLVLWIVAFAPVTIGIFGGANVAGFWELVAKTLPANRRASNLSGRNIIGTALGLAAGGIVTAVLARWPGPEGYGVLYLFNFAGMLLSAVGLLCIREIPHHPLGSRQSFGPLAKLRILPQWLRTDPVMRNYALARIFSFGIGVLTPFLAIHAREVLAKPESFLGQLVTVQMAGAIVGNLLGAWLGDRHGGRILAQLGGLLGLALCFGALINRTENGFLVMFFVLGMTTFLTANGAMVLQMELFSPERRPTCYALISAAVLPTVLLAAWVAGVLWDRTGAIWPGAACAAMLLLVSQWYFWRLPEPRAQPA